MMEYIFDFRCYHSIGRGWHVVKCYREEGISVEGINYEDCLKQARKEFRRRNYYLEHVPDEEIEILNSIRL